MTDPIAPACWRSLLFVPAHVERFVARAHERGADAVVLDLEDAVPAAEKPAARERLAEAADHASRIRKSAQQRSDELDVRDVVIAEDDVHEPGDRGVRRGVLVVLDTLDQRAGAVADAGDRDADGTHVVLLAFF